MSLPISNYQTRWPAEELVIVEHRLIKIIFKGVAVSFLTKNGPWNQLTPLFRGLFNSLSSVGLL